MIRNSSSSPKRSAASRRGGFTLIEILVAVAIMSLLLGIILVPLRLGFETYHIGKARADVQQEAQLTLQQIGNDIRRSQFVFANTSIQGVTKNTDPTSPCATQPYKQGTGTNAWNYQPYVRSTTNVAAPVGPTTSTANYGVCDTGGVQPWSNPSRIDMLQVRRDDNGQGQSSKVGQDFIISYYPRRLDISKPYDIVDNPMVLFRAQIPYRKTPTDELKNGSGDYNAQIDWTTYPSDIGSCAPSSGQTNRSFSWITHNLYGEANLEPLTADAKDNSTPPQTLVVGAHTLATPLGMGLVAPRDAGFGSGNIAQETEALVPELTFAEEATKGSRIDRVTVTMTLAIYDQAGAGSVNGQGKAQRVRVSQTFDIPNAGCSP